MSVNLIQNKMKKMEKKQKMDSSDLVTTIKVDNLSCEGCVNTIEKKLMSMKGIVKVNVLLEDQEIMIIHKKGVNIDNLKETLKKLGYPETGTTHGIDKISRNLKSYVSCAIGRLNNLKHEKS